MKTIFLSCLFSLFLACASHSSNQSAPRLTQDFQSRLAAVVGKNYAEFQITKIYSQQNNSADLISKRLSAGLLEDSLATNQQDFYFKALEKNHASHIGAVVVTYPSIAIASSRFSAIGRTGFFDNSKILTRYIANLSESAIVILYSESAADNEVKTYMEELAESLPAAALN